MHQLKTEFLKCEFHCSYLKDSMILSSDYADYRTLLPVSMSGEGYLKQHYGLHLTAMLATELIMSITEFAFMIYSVFTKTGIRALTAGR